MKSFGSTELWRKRQMSPGLDSFCRIIFANMKADTPEELHRSMIYAYKKTLATKMWREGFKFRPAFRANNEDYRHTLNKCDYQMEINITGKRLELEITL